MKGIVIAAGSGLRMGSLTETMPKCLLPVAGRPLLDWTIERLRAAGCTEIVVIVGHRGELVRPADATIVENRQYRDNNILHSLMNAREHFDGPLMVSYSDIWVEPEIHLQLAAAPGDIVPAVDTDWQPYYEGRSQHPLSEAEKIMYDSAGRARKFGKHLPAESAGDAAAGLRCGEFLGLWRMSAHGARQFREVFLDLDAKLAPLAPFQNAASWHKAYITDLFQELADRGHAVHCAMVQRGWGELDTLEDYERLPAIAARQRLHSLQSEKNWAGVMDEVRRLKAIGARVLGEANDLKRTPEALAHELGWKINDVRAVISGAAPAAAAESLLHSMSANYPVPLADLWVERDDTDRGVRIMTAAQSAASARVFDRPDRSGKPSPYYEYRDTAMSRTAPFKPEWIEELRIVHSAAADDPDVAFNKGHFLHQTTFFVGPVNFYWETGGRRHMAEMDTGDSNYITPFVPHSFASRRAEQRGLIVAVTYAAGVRSSLAELARLGSAAAEELAGDLRRPDEARRARFARHLAMESLTAGEFVGRVTAQGMGKQRAHEILLGQSPNAAEVELCASALNVRAADLTPTPLRESEEVVIRKRADATRRPFPADGPPAYQLTELARSRHQPQLKGFEVEVVGGSGGEFRHSLHEYVYNYGETGTRLHWSADGKEHSAVLAPGDSAYVRPMVAHRFARLPGEAPARLVTIRVPGGLTDQVLDEFAGMAKGRHRAAGETERWF